MRRHNLFATLAIGVAPMLALGLPVVMSGSAATAQEAADKAEQKEQKTDQQESKADQPSTATKAQADSSADAPKSSTEKSQPSSATKASGNGASKAGQSTKAEGSASSSTKAAGSDASASGSGELQLNQPGNQSETDRSNQADRSSNQADRSSNQADRSSRQNGAQRRTANRPESSTESSTDANRTEASTRSRTSTETDSDDATTSDDARSRTRRSAASQNDDADDQSQQRRTQGDRSMRDQDDARSDRTTRDRDDVDVRSDRTTRDRDVDVRSDSRRDRRFSQDRDSRTSVRADRRDSRTRFRSFSDFGLSVSIDSDRLVVDDIRRNSVLRRYGIRQGDVIVSVSGHPVTTEADFIEYVLVEDVDRVPVVVLRDGREETLYIVPEEIYVGDTVDVQADYQQSAAAYLGVSLDRNYRGARVADVQPGSPAEEAGIGRGDVILAINGREIRSPAEVTQIVQQMEPGETIEVDLQRQVTDVVNVELGAQRGRTAARSSYDVDVDVEPSVRTRERVDVDVYDRGPAYRDDFDARLEYQDRTRTRSSQSFEQDRTLDNDRIRAEGRFEAGGAIQRDSDSGRSESGRQGGLRGIFRGGR
jgi:C-terminal processing protease CtpA/Prc